MNACALLAASRTVDLVIQTLTSGYSPAPYSVGAELRNGCSGHAFGRIHLDRGTDVEVLFSFESSEHAPVTLPSFSFSFFDLDEHEVRSSARPSPATRLAASLLLAAS